MLFAIKLTTFWRVHTLYDDVLHATKVNGAFKDGRIVGLQTNKISEMRDFAQNRYNKI